MFAYAPIFSFGLLIAILLGFWGKHIAESKNIPGFVGFLLGFFGHLIGIIILAVLPPLRTKKVIFTQSDYDNARNKIHPRTNTSNIEKDAVKTKAFFCPHCSNEIEVMVGYEMYECPKCSGKFTL